jgi:hypothetical protein
MSKLNKYLVDPRVRGSFYIPNRLTLKFKKTQQGGKTLNISMLDDIEDDLYSFNDSLTNVYKNDKDVLLIKDSKYNLRNNTRVPKSLIKDMVLAARKSGIDPYDFLATGLRESNLGYKNSYNPMDIMSNRFGTNLGLSNKNAFYEKNSIPESEYNKALAYVKAAKQYPFWSEANTFKKLGLKGYNAGDSSYSKKVAKEKEILTSKENKALNDFILGIKQQGGEDIKVIAENNEWVKMDDGSIARINDAPIHDDNERFTDSGFKKVKNNKGGVELSGIQSVISATHENRNSNDESYTDKDEEIKIKPKEAIDIATQLGFKINKPTKSISPGKLLDLTIESKNKFLGKFKQTKTPYSIEAQASLKANEAVINSMLSDEDLYDAIFSVQENKKQGGANSIAQDGGIFPIQKQYTNKLKKYL